MKISDPYDIWATPYLGRLKSKWTQGHRLKAFIVPIVGLAEVFFPSVLRVLLRTPKHEFQHVEAMLFLSGLVSEKIVLDKFRKSQVGNCAWGLPFAWYSKNGTYSANTPYVTNTPYVMQALLCMKGDAAIEHEAKSIFHQTWQFLDSLQVMYEEGDELALSYAPVDEPRPVVNANSYAAVAYALHAVNGLDVVKSQAQDRAVRLVNWILSQQQNDGSWYYYADENPGNFIDCFHSCFVIKNLIKIKKLIPELSVRIDPSIHSGWSFLQKNFFDEKYGLCRRFTNRDIKDPFRWDLYDQAEYLGLMVDFGLHDDANIFLDHIESVFKKGDSWYCRIDIFGRRWGKNFMRWGIVPFLYHKARLDRELKKATSLCAE